jgi:hypothetical protein
MHIVNEEYSINYDSDKGVVHCKGSFLLNGTEAYAPILELLLKITKSNRKQAILDIRDLELLNSSGINTLTKFVIQVRNNKIMNLTVQGDAEVPWQVRLIRNLQRLMPAIVIEMS